MVLPSACSCLPFWLSALFPQSRLTAISQINIHKNQNCHCGSVHLQFSFSLLNFSGPFRPPKWTVSQVFGSFPLAVLVRCNCRSITTRNKTEYVRVHDLKMSTAATEDSDGHENEHPLFVLDAAEENEPGLALTESNKPFKKWMDSIRARNRRPGRGKLVEGWSEHSEADMLSPSSASQQRSERCSGISSHLGTVETTTLSTNSQVVSRSNTRSSTNRSANSEASAFADSPTSTVVPPALDEAAENRAFKRRQVLQEIVSTELNYVLGLKVLSDVRQNNLSFLFFFFFFFFFFLWLVYCVWPLADLHFAVFPTQSLSILSTTRYEIYINLQQLRNVHEQFLSTLQEASPVSWELASSDDRSAASPNGPSESPIRGARGLRNKALRTRQSIIRNSRMIDFAATPSEALAVARKIEDLVCFDLQITLLSLF